MRLALWEMAVEARGSEAVWKTNQIFPSAVEVFAEKCEKTGIFKKATKLVTFHPVAMNF